MMNATLRGKPDAGNPHVRFDEGEVVPTKPRRGSLLYKEFLKNACVACLIGTALAGPAASSSDPGLSPIPDTWKGRGFECVAPSQAQLPRFCNFVEKTLAPAGINTIFLRIDKSYRFVSHPECAVTNGLTAADAKTLCETCARAGVKIVPTYGCFGHLSDNKGVVHEGLLKGHPEFDEGHGRPIDYHYRLLCPQHPGVHKVVTEMLNEIVAAFGADTIHIGCDEVTGIGTCEKCRKVAKAKLFADWVNSLARHLKAKGVTTMIWGDRLIDHKECPYDVWESSTSGTHAALDLLDRDIVICDWHYYETPPYPSVKRFTEAGFRTWICVVRFEKAARMFIEAAKRDGGDKVDGIMYTNWLPCDRMMNAYEGKPFSDFSDPLGRGSEKPRLAVQTFCRLFPKADQKRARMPVLMNEDCFHYFLQAGSTAKEIRQLGGEGQVRDPKFDLTKTGLESYIDEIARGGVTHFLMNVNGQKTMYPSKVWESVWTSLDDPKLDHLTWVANLKAAYARGVDPFAVWIARCRERGITPWVSLRMNDLHVIVDENCGFVSDFWRQHSELHLCPNAKWNGRKDWGACHCDGLDYSKPQVRARMLSLVREVLARYHPDGIEFDFLRHYSYLPDGRERELSHCLTDFMREARKIVRDSSDAAVTLAVRLPQSPAKARAAGFDADVWSRQGLMDAIIPCNNYFESVSDLPVDEWRKWVGGNIRLYAGSDAFLSEKGKSRKVKLGEYRDWANRMWAKGADGFYLFNLFCQPRQEVWDEILANGL